jgi:hypothetical protein
MSAVQFITVAATTYLAAGTVVCLIHPRLFRREFGNLRNADLGPTGVFSKPIMALAIVLLFILLWPVAWFNAGKSEKKAREEIAAQLERLRPFAKLYATINQPVRYAGGDGSSFETAVVILGANQLSGVRAQYDYLNQHYFGYQVHRQSLKEHNGRKFSVIELGTAAGDDETLYFDISAYLPG